MAQHGYLGDNYGSEYDPNYDDDGSDRDDRRWRSESRQDWRGEDRGRRSFMFDDRSGGSDWNDDEDRGGRARNRRGSDAREWFGGRPGIRDDRWQGDRNRASSHPDDHYRSWRDKQMQALDRDYEDYCREREQQFHQDFDSWRQSRQQQQNLGLRAPWGPEQGNGADEQTFTPQTTAVSNTMTTSETHEPQTTTEPDRIATVGTTARKR